MQHFQLGYNVVSLKGYESDRDVQMLILFWTVMSLYLSILGRKYSWKSMRVMHYVLLYFRDSLLEEVG